MTAVSVAPRQVWRAARGPAAIILVIIVAGIVIALVRGGGEGGSLDPRSVTPSGSRALARLLEAEGVRIERVETAADAEAATAAGPATLLITRPELLVPQRLDELAAGPAELVLIAPVEVRGLRTVGATEVADRAPDCALEAATVAGQATMGGLHYEGAEQRWGWDPRRGSVLTLCYSGTLARTGSVTVLGTGEPLTNASVAKQGNAALAMRLLGRHDRLVWYLPSVTDPSLRPEQRQLVELLPAGWTFGLVQLGIAVGVCALWRARRLGPVVTEPLPVVVRAAETVQGRARLYRRAGAADHAADALRQAARDRLVPRLGLPRGADPHAVAGALAERTGRPSAQVYDLLYGPPPTGDAALVRLADALDALEKAL